MKTSFEISTAFSDRPILGGLMDSDPGFFARHNLRRVLRLMDSNPHYFALAGVDYEVGFWPVFKSPNLETQF